jgi:hypothetical protein
MTAAVSIPSTPSDVTAEWLSGVLSADVAAVEISPIGTGQTGATYRVAVRYVSTAGASPTGLPDSFAVKLPSQDDSVRERVALGYRSEHAFYTRIADRVAAPIPHCYHCEIASDGADFVLLLSDMAPAVQGDQIAGCSAAEATLAVEALAGLHGPSWCDAELAASPGITMPLPDEAGAKGLGEIAQMAAGITADKLGDRLSDAARDTLLASMALAADWLLAEPTRFALLHGDYRLDNLLFTPDRGRVTVVDWQTLSAGLPARDLAYFTGTSLLPADRAAVEDTLVAAYHARLLSHGVTGYDLETCRRDYRLGMLQVPMLTALGCAFASSTDRGDEMMRVMLERGCQAIRELGSLELISA